GGLAPAGGRTGYRGTNGDDAVGRRSGDGLGLDVCSDVWSAPRGEGISGNSNEELTRRDDGLCNDFDVRGEGSLPAASDRHRVHGDHGPALPDVADQDVEARDQPLQPDRGGQWAGEHVSLSTAGLLTG